MRRWLIVPGLLTLALLAAALGASAASTSAQIVNCASTTWCFSPNPITVTAGSTVTWTNGTAAPHTATANNGAWTTGTVPAGGTSGAITFSTPGTFVYHCAIHPSMTATVMVTAATVATAAPSAPARPAIKGLAQSGGGPLLPVAAAVILLGLGLLRPAWLRRRPRER